MLPRWETQHNNLNFAIPVLRRLSRKLIRKKEGRGRNPKHNPTKYAELIVIKEFCNALSLRKAEVRLSEFVVGERVDHSVIAYWENKPEIARCLQIIVRRAGKILEKYLGKLFTFVDATKFSTWHIDEIQFHTCNIISKDTVFPIGISFLTGSVVAPVDEAVPPGSGQLLADAGYDDNKTIGILFKKGYEPIVCPNKGRYRGYWRRKARKLYKLGVNKTKYRQRGRGESNYGSLTNEFGDRMHARKKQSLEARTTGRVISYQIKLIVRCEEDRFFVEVLIFRHALLGGMFK